MACVGTGRLLVADTGWHALAVKALPKLEMRWWTAAPAERECNYAGWLVFVRSDTEAIGSGAIVGSRRWPQQSHRRLTNLGSLWAAR